MRSNPASQMKDAKIVMFITVSTIVRLTTGAATSGLRSPATNVVGAHYVEWPTRPAAVATADSAMALL